MYVIPFTLFDDSFWILNINNIMYNTQYLLYQTDATHILSSEGCLPKVAIKCCLLKAAINAVY